MPELPLDGARYYVETTGSGPPLLLLHGFTGSIETWAPHIPVLAEKAQVVAVDILGHGRSASPADERRYRMDLVASDLKDREFSNKADHEGAIL